MHSRYSSEYRSSVQDKPPLAPHLALNAYTRRFLDWQEIILLLTSIPRDDKRRLHPSGPERTYGNSPHIVMLPSGFLDQLSNQCRRFPLARCSRVDFWPILGG